MHGATDWINLFRTMKENAEEADNMEVRVRISRKDPEDSQANYFYMSEQIFRQACEEKHAGNSIDLQ